jgi:hypothetical protein
MKSLRWIGSVLLLLVAIPSCGRTGVRETGSGEIGGSEIGGSETGGTGGGGAGGGSGGTGSGNAASIPPADFPATFVDALCSYGARCGLMPDKASCVTATAVDPSLTKLQAGVKAGRIKYDDRAAAACLDVVRSQSCNYSDGLALAPQACKDTFSGQVPDGGGCYVDTECISRSCDIGSCPSLETCCAGICGPTVSTGPAGIGADCMGTHFECVDGAFCSSKVTCQAKAGLGQPCDHAVAAESCVAGAYCVANGPNTATCGALPAEGESCYSPGIGYSPACDSRRDYCDSVTMECVPRIPVGGVCSAYYGADSDAGCVGYATCDATGQCVANAQEGEVCDDVNGPQCLGSLVCSSGTCALPPATTVCQ